MNEAETRAHYIDPALKDDAKLYIKDMVKKHKLKRQKGFWGNAKTGVELTSNF